MAKQPKYDAVGADVFVAPVVTATGTSLGFRLCTCADEGNAAPLAEILNQHHEAQRIIAELLEAPFNAPVWDEARDLLNRMLAP